MRKPEITYYGISDKAFDRYHVLKPYFENLKETHQYKWTMILLVIAIPLILYNGGWSFISEGMHLGSLILKSILVFSFCAFLMNMVSIPLAHLTLKIELFVSSKDHNFYQTMKPLILRFENDLETYYRLQEKKEREAQRKKQEALRRQKAFWRSLTGIQFEGEMANIFEKLGYKVTLTRGSGDEGVDLFLRQNNEVAIVQCKAHKKPVPPAVVRDLYGTMLHNKADQAILVSLAGFTKGVRDFVQGKAIKLLSLNDILRIQNELALPKTSQRNNGE